jgi:hypothetical protein
MKLLKMMRMNYSTQKIVVPIMIVGLGNTVFVRQLKLIWQNQRINIKKNHFQKKKNQFSSTLSSTVCLLHAIFEDLGCAIELHEKIVNEDIELLSLDPRNYLFDGQEEGDYLFGQGIIQEVSIDDKEYLQLYGLWCLFAYREFYKNLLVIFDEISLRTFGGKKQVFQTDLANSLIFMMIKIHAFLMKLSNNTYSDIGLSYQTVMNNQSYTIRSWIT